MILGIGNDLTDIRRIAQVIEAHGERFIRRCFTTHEQEICEARRERAAGYAKRFAAKEACAKALGTGMADGVFWRDIEVVTLEGGKPELRLAGGALARLNALTPKGSGADIHLSISDEYPLAQAFVIIAAVPAG